MSSFRRIVVLAVFFRLTVALPAHELGGTQVNAEFRPDGSFQIDITVDPDALLGRLEVYSRSEISSNLTPAERDRRIAALGDVLLDRVEIRFDGSRRQPRFEYLPAAPGALEGLPPGEARSLPARVEGLPLDQARSRVRLTGRRPAGAETWTFLHGAAIGAFAMDVAVDEGPVQTIWLEGGRRSAPLPLAPGQNLQAWAERASWMAIGLVALCWHARRLVQRLASVAHRFGIVQ